MEVYLIISTSFSFIIGICQVLKVGKLIRLKELKKLYPEATLKDIESFEKNTKTSCFFKKRRRNKNKKP